MDDNQLPSVLFLCDVRKRCFNVRDSNSDDSTTIMKEYSNFCMNVEKFMKKQIQHTTLLSRGRKLLARFPDLMLRFERLIEAPRKLTHNPPAPATTTGKFAPLDTLLIWQHILHLLPHSTIACMAKTCKWLHTTIDTELLVGRRQHFEDTVLMRPIITGGDAPVRIMTTEYKPLDLYIIDRNRNLMGMGYEGKWYVLDAPSMFRRIMTWQSNRHEPETHLHTILDQISKAASGQPLDLVLWAKVTPMAYDFDQSLRVEITAYGQFNKITRKHEGDGAKHWFAVHADRINWAPIA